MNCQLSDEVCRFRALLLLGIAWSGDISAMTRTRGAYTF